MYPPPMPVIPKIDYASAKQAHKLLDRLDKFVAFERAGQNPDLRTILAYRQHNRCPICHEIIAHPCSDEAQVHHSDYTRYCWSNLTKRYAPDTKGNIYREVPNCDLCFADRPEISEQCLSTLYLLHAECHDTLHKNSTNN